MEEIFVSAFAKDLACTLGSAYNEQFDAQKCIRSSRVLVVSWTQCSDDFALKFVFDI